MVLTTFSYRVGLKDDFVFHRLIIFSFEASSLRFQNSITTIPLKSTINFQAKLKVSKNSFNCSMRGVLLDSNHNKFKALPE